MFAIKKNTLNKNILGAHSVLYSRYNWTVFAINFHERATLSIIGECMIELAYIYLHLLLVSVWRNTFLCKWRTIPLHILFNEIGRFVLAFTEVQCAIEHSCAMRMHLTKKRVRNTWCYVVRSPQHKSMCVVSLWLCHKYVCSSLYSSGLGLFLPHLVDRGCSGQLWLLAK